MTVSFRQCFNSARMLLERWHRRSRWKAFARPAAWLAAIKRWRASSRAGSVARADRDRLALILRERGIETQHLLTHRHLVIWQLLMAAKSQPMPAPIPSELSKLGEQLQALRDRAAMAAAIGVADLQNELEQMKARCGGALLAASRPFTISVVTDLPTAPIAPRDAAADQYFELIAAGVTPRRSCDPLPLFQS